MTDLPTPRSIQGTGLCIRVWCKAGCHHQTDKDPQTLIDVGHGDRPRCRYCGEQRRYPHRRTTCEDRKSPGSRLD
jgi:hypothetical protein